MREMYVREKTKQNIAPTAKSIEIPRERNNREILTVIADHLVTQPENGQDNIEHVYKKLH